MSPGCARIHGLLRYTEYTAIDRQRDSVTLSARIYPQLGYPFLLGTAVHYELVADGLRVTHFVENLGAGTWFFALRSLNQQGVASQMSNPVTKTVG